MIPAAYANQVGDAELAEKPVGTGPYKFMSWTEGQQVVLEANTDYWKGPPDVKTVVFPTIPELATQIAELLAGSVDIISTIPPDQVPLIEASGSAYVSKTPILNPERGIPQLRWPWTGPHLADSLEGCASTPGHCPCHRSGRYHLSCPPRLGGVHLHRSHANAFWL
jgi:ABC-type transport system substrate-binding protein